MTTLSLGTVRHLSSAAAIESLLFFLGIIPLKKSRGAENRTRGAELERYRCAMTTAHSVPELCAFRERRLT